MAIPLRLGLCLAACCAALVFPASSAAITCAPPGNSGVDQYFETVPGSSCNNPSSGPGSGSHGLLPPGTSNQLSKQGSVGQAVNRLVTGSTAGRSNAGVRSGARGAGPGNARRGIAISGSGSSALSGLLGPVLTGSSSGGVGILLPIFLGVVLVLVLGGVALRRRLGSG